jgi:predicted RNA-binding protein YlxR (DUF448 family)
MTSKPKQMLLRLVAREGRPEIDPTGKTNGRGVYLCKDVSCFDKARKKKAISRGLTIEGLTEDDWEELRAAFALYSEQ